jgi:hypothetical protein
VTETACISHITEQVVYRIKKSECNQDNRIVEADRQNLIIYNGLVLVRDNGKFLGSNNLGVDKKRGKKVPITTYSKDSRLNHMKHLAMLKYPPKFWFDLTYTDGVMEGLSVKQRREKSSDDLHKFIIWAERKYGHEIFGMWRRGWMPRLSGILKGQHLPHFHNIITVPKFTDKEYLDMYFRMADKWLEITGAEGKYKADGYRVLYNEKSYRFINSQKSARKYMNEYISKKDELKTGESIGRSWGHIGDSIEREPEIMEIKNDEMVLLKRMMRKLCKGLNKKVKYGLSFCLKHRLTKFFVLMEKQTIYGMLEYIRAGDLCEGVPF